MAFSQAFRSFPVEYLQLVNSAGCYGVMPFDKRLKGNPALLAYIHVDEPDLPSSKSKVKIQPSKKLRIKKKHLYGKFSMVSPIAGRFLIRSKEPSLP